MNPYEPPQSSLEHVPETREPLPLAETPPAATWLTILKIIVVCGLIWFETVLGILLLNWLLHAVGFLSNSELQDVDFLVPYFSLAFCGIGLILWWWYRIASAGESS